MHIEKMNLQGAKMTINHDLRNHEEYRNKDIDHNKTKDNLILHDTDPLEKMKNRIEEIYIYGRNGKHKNDINYICSVCVQYPNNCNIDEDEFFNAMDCVLSKRFGYKNKISSVVHKDEKGKSHLHFKFMPVIYNEQKKREELCAKKVVNRSMLLTFHKDVENDLKSLGYDIKLHEPDKHIEKTNIKDIEEYKKLQDILGIKQNEIDELNKIIDNKLAEVESIEVGKKLSLIDKFYYLIGKKDKEHEEDVISLESKLNNKEKQINSMQKQLDKAMAYGKQMSIYDDIPKMTGLTPQQFMENIRFLNRMKELDIVKNPYGKSLDQRIKDNQIEHENNVYEHYKNRHEEER